VQSEREAPHPLICLPHAGGNASVYEQIVAYTVGIDER